MRQVEKNNSIEPLNDNPQRTNSKFSDLKGTWVDKRIVTNIGEVNRSEVFTPVSGFWFYEDIQTGKPMLTIEYDEHDHRFVFDTLVFKRELKGAYDSCFSFQDNKMSYLLLFSKKDTMIRDLQLIDSGYLRTFQPDLKTYARIEPLPVAGVEQFAMGRYLVDSVFNIEYGGKQYKIQQKFDGVFYRIKGFPNYGTIQYYKWEMKDQKVIQIFLAGKEDFENFMLIEKDSAVYELRRNHNRQELY